MKLLHPLILLTSFTLTLTLPQGFQEDPPWYQHIKQPLPKVDPSKPLCREFKNEVKVKNLGITPFIAYMGDSSHVKYLNHMNDGVTSSYIDVIINDGLIQLDFNHTPHNEPIPSKILVWFNDKEGDKTGKVHGWWIDTSKTNSCYHKTDYKLAAIRSIEYKRQQN